MITLLFISFFLLFILRIPVAFALFLSSLLVIVVSGIPPVVVIQKTFEGMTPFSYSRHSPVLSCRYSLEHGRLH